jgi:2-alkenal reductase
MVKRSIAFSVLAAIILAATIACGALPLTAQTFGQSQAPQQVAPQQPIPVQPAQAVPSAPVNLPTVQVSGPLASYEQTLIAVYNAVSPSVVHIRTDSGEASGFVWDTNGHIVTNNHVVSGANQIEVTFSDGTTLPAQVVGTDVNADLAVISIKTDGLDLHPVQLADSTHVQVGQVAIAIGNPFGLEGTMTVGIVSGLGRDLQVDNTTTNGNSQSYTIPDIIQTDAPINPGNSGGVLVDDSGRLIGVTSAIASPVRASSGVGFVIPSVIVNKVVPALIKNGHYDHTWLGVSGATLTPDAATKLGVAANQHGAVMMQILPNGPAGKAGLQSGDVITGVDGQPVKRFEDLTTYMARSTDVGQTITLTVIRGGKQISVQVLLEARPAQ